MDSIVSLIHKLEKHWVTLCLIIVLVTSFGLMFASAKSDSMIIDEKVHISAGYLHTWRGNYLFNPEHPPLLNDIAGFFIKFSHPSIPETYKTYTQENQEWEYGDDLFYKPGNNIVKMLIFSRFPFILFTLGIIYLIFLFGRAFYNEKIGLFAATLVAFEPNILAHGHLATTDIGLVFFWLLALWIFRKYLLKPGSLKATYLGLTLGLVLVAKFSGAILLPAVFLTLIGIFIIHNRSWKQVLKELGIIFLSMIIVVWIVYAFSMRGDIIQNINDPVTLNSWFGSKVINSEFLKWTILPFDKFIYGYQRVGQHNAVGHWAYLNGVVGYNGWWYYFPLTMWYKLPVSILLIIFLSIISLYWFLKAKYFDKYYLEILLIGLPIVLFLGISMISKIDIGIRHILPIIPLVYLAAVGIFNRDNHVMKILLILVLLWQIFVGIKSGPNYIAYFNEIAGGTQNGSKHLLDSNLDWDQNMGRFANYVHQEKISKVNALCWDEGYFRYYHINYELLTQPVQNEVVAICLQHYYIPPDGFDFEWIKKYPPDINISGGIYVWRFDLHPIE